MNHPPNILNLVFLIAIITSLLYAFSPKNAFAGSGVGWIPSLHVFSDAGGERPPDLSTGAGDAALKPQPEVPDPKKAEGEDIQEFAAKVAKEDADRAARGESAPNLPATSQNLAKFHDRDNLPPDEKKAFQPVKPEGEPIIADSAEGTVLVPGSKAEVVAGTKPAPPPPEGEVPA